MTRAAEIERAIARELPDDWRVKLPPNPTPAQEAEAFAADAATLDAAWQRVRARKRAALAEWHREQLNALEEAA